LKLASFLVTGISRLQASTVAVTLLRRDSFVMNPRIERLKFKDGIKEQRESDAFVSLAWNCLPPAPFTSRLRQLSPHQMHWSQRTASIDDELTAHPFNRLTCPS
jgi:hypothetical protein